jgi:tetratricopeptide (TPR) repeat protein
VTESRTVRLFLSSTFRDFGEERDLLVKRVFPALRARLRERFVELVDVDLRWGITVEEAERGEVLPICLAEIDRARPYFIGMLGERYGWIPPPDGYAADLLERQPWLKKHQGGKSVTELEILHGVLNNRRMQGRAFFYFRSPAYARVKGGDYLPSTEDHARQTELKRRIRERGLPVTSYANPEALAKRIERDLWKLLDAEFPATAVPDAFERERLRHEAYAAPRRRLYLGGERYQAALLKLLEAEEPRILIEGASGGGKSALLANFFDAYRKRHRSHLVHEHYLGASADAADPHALVRRLIEFIQRTTHSREEIPGDPQELMDCLPDWLATASAWARKRRTRFIFVLDSLNSLTEQQDLRWWPAFLPRGITTLVSCLPGPVHDALKGNTEALPGQDKTAKWKTVTVRPLTKAQSATLLNTYLARFNKKLPRQMVKQVQAHPLATNPLFLRTLAEELRLFGVHEELQERLDHYLTSQTVDDLFERVLQRVEKDCGKKQVKAAMTVIWASRAGLTEKEILGIAELTPATWAAIRHALDEALVEVSGKITFGHDYVRASVRSLYLPKADLVRRSHKLLATWFSEQPLGARKAEEEAWQLRCAKDARGLLICLGDREAVLNMYEHTGVVELSEHWLAAEVLNKQRMELFLRKRWPAWIRGLSQANQRQCADVLIELLQQAGRLTHFTVHLARRTLAIARADGDMTNHDLVKYINTLAVILKDRGQYKKAEPLYLEALEIASRFSAPHRESLATRLNNLAVLYRATDRLDEAETLYRRSQEISRQTSGAFSEPVAITLSNLVPVLRMKGQLAQALVCANSAIATLRRVLGTDHPRLVTVLNNRGQLLKSMRRSADAEATFNEAVLLGRRLLGPDHPTVALVLNNLADLLSEDRPDDASAFAAEALRIRRAALPPEHPDLAVTLNVLGDIARERRDFATAVSRYQEALAVSTYAGASDDMASALNSIGLVHHDNGQLEDARRNYERALHLLYGAGLGHSRRALILLNNLAMVLKESGDLPGALDLAERGLKLRQRLFPELRVRLATATHNVASILEEVGRRDDAARLYRRALDLIEATLGSAHEEALTTLVSLATLLADQGRNDKALKLLLRARNIAQTRLGPEHPRTGQVLYHLGHLLSDMGRVTEARSTLEQEIRIAKTHDGARSNSVRLSLRGLGVVLLDHGMLHDADLLLTEARDIAVYLYGQGSAETSAELCVLGRLRASQDRLTEARDLLQEGLRLMRTDPATDPEAVLKISTRLEAVVARIAEPDS